MPSGSEKLVVHEPHSRIRALSAIGSAVAIDQNIPLHRYFRSGSEMLRMAKMYNDDGQLESAFILYSKYITLFVEKLPKHQDYSSASVHDKATVKKNLNLVFPCAEKLKSCLLEKYTEEYDSWQEEQKRIEAEQQMQQLRISEEQERENRLRKEYEKEKAWRLAQEKEKLRRPASNSSALSELGKETRSDSTYITDEYNYGLLSGSSVSPSPTISSQGSVGVTTSDSSKRIIPTIDRSTKPRSLLSPGPEAEYVHGLRLVVVPSSLMETFLNLAESNTVNNVETCGILAGKMSHSELLVTHLLVPKQTGTADSCSTDNEEELFTYQDEKDLITLGWIHTHPSQTAFMSSVDLHTHCAYQLMMPEAIAIVCAPKHHETGMFSLTPDYGVDYIAGCCKTGFHPHPKEPPLYEECTHVKLSHHRPVTVVDLRKKSA